MAEAHCLRVIVVKSVPLIAILLLNAVAGSGDTLESLSSRDISKSGRTALIVDDEPEVLRLLQAILIQEGYGVVAAQSADTAIKVFERLPQHPDLLVVDVVMPGLSGPMLVDQLRRLDPGLKVLFISGYPRSKVVRRYVLDSGFQLLAKPFTIRGLRMAIDVLNEDSERAGQRGPVH
jgi:two-component system, cell cycle sensor histidine kinase and response regulator CckA